MTRWILGLALTGALTAQALAQDLRVPLDQAAAVRLSQPAAGVVVGNPSIAGVSVQNDRLLFVTGRAYGTTNLVVVGRDGRTIYNGRVNVSADEVNTVIVTRGASTTRLACAPSCRRQPDISDSQAEFEITNDQIAGRTERVEESR